MKKNGKGSIINISSINAIVAMTEVPPYHAAKGAVRIMARVDALYYAKENIRVNSIAPGYVLTPMLVDYYKDQSGFDIEKIKKEIGNLCPMEKLPNQWI